MKKILAITLVLSMMLMLVPAMAESTAAGIWYLTAMQTGDVELSPADLGIGVTMALNEDGSCTLSSVGADEPETIEGTWTQDGDTITVNADEEMVFTLADGLLTTDIGDGIMVFSTEEPVAVELPAAIAAESEDAFFGTWTVSYVSLEGMTVDAETMGANFTAIIEAGKITMNNLSAEDEEDAAVEAVTTFADGVLTAYENEEAIFTVQAADNGGIILNALEDGEIFMSMYFDKAE